MDGVMEDIGGKRKMEGGFVGGMEEGEDVC